MSSGTPSNQNHPGGSSCNAVSLAFTLSVVAFAVLGYLYTSPLGLLGAVGGVIGGVVVGSIATPFVFLLLMLLVHIGVKIEDRFRKPRD